MRQVIYIHSDDLSTQSMWPSWPPYELWGLTSYRHGEEMLPLLYELQSWDHVASY